MNLISKCELPLEQFQSWALKNNADEFFIHKTIPTLYRLSVEEGLNPLFTIAQATKETGWGHFRGQVKKEFNNVCGLKKTDGEKYTGSEQFAIFETIEEGCRAFLEHICLYLGVEGYPLINPKDTRHFKPLFGKATTPLKLCKEWTGEDTYTEYYTRIMEIIEEIEETELIEIVKEHDDCRADEDLDEEIINYKEEVKRLENENLQLKMGLEELKNKIVTMLA